MTPQDLTRAAELVNGVPYETTTTHVGGHALDVGVLRPAFAVDRGEHPFYWLDSAGQHDANLYVTTSPEGDYDLDTMRQFGTVLRRQAA